MDEFRAKFEEARRERETHFDFRHELLKDEEDRESVSQSKSVLNGSFRGNHSSSSSDEEQQQQIPRGFRSAAGQEEEEEAEEEIEDSALEKQ